MGELTKMQNNVLAAIKSMIRRDRRWLPLSVLNSFDGRTVRALHRRGFIEINADYGVRPL
jgi:hypothetical protein